ncbi:conserved hypothetical protein [Tenacibaculum maritimum]|uniref:hypothetical protein n=1 Tax=Tenacibaculum maritimum TaxID=107401 RepID=UPI0012E4D30D|nr:hypothetical protein [Tenacibaculum maritimum]MCD9582278.1 hypothetical protein [Tenacibaculum maritimum]MCD9636660.1 hypothetical protein [Tenacibaculum maritimum]CAA0144722.1 conserved hypothetical protein [Tenacibaculum maritimum]CAA0193573.1 conserved hypothetical protein [Tenacibaculum maritimum]
MEKLIRALGSVGNKGLKTSIGTVTKITGDTCSVKREELAELLDVRLNAVVGDFDSSFMVFPKVGSLVLVLEIENNPSETAIVKYTEIDRVQIKVEKFELDVDKDGLLISNQGENLKAVTNDLIDEINKILVIQGNTINVTAMNAIKERYNKILK